MGVVTTYFSGSDESANATIVQPDGKVIVVGQAGDAGATTFAIARYNVDGSLDPAFGQGGKVTTSISGMFDSARGVALQSDGKIVVVGDTGPTAFADAAIVRYNVDGSLDTSFGNGGIVIEDIGGMDEQQFSCVAVLSDGQILIGGEAKTAGNGWFEFALARFNSDGSLDLSFGTSGSVMWDYIYAYGLGGEYANFMVVQPDGKILLGGQLSPDSSIAAIVVRFNADGSWDQGFGHDWLADDLRVPAENGVLTLSDFAAEALVIQPDGKLDLACTGRSGASLIRLDANGTTWDDSFGYGGEGIISLNSADVYGEVLEPDGSILLAGSYGLFGSGIALARLTSAGALDASFNGTGVKLYSFGGVDDGIADAVLQTDGKLLVVGHKGLPDSTSQFAVARFLDDGTPDPTEQMFDLNGPSRAGLSYTTSWSNAGPVHVTDPAATVSDSILANLTSLTVAVSSPQSGDTLVADNSTHPAIAVSFAAGTLSLSGSAPQADYADVLRTITYDNSSPTLGVGTVTLNISASDGTLTSTTETTTLLVGTLELDLNGAAAGTDFSSSWSGFAALPVAITDIANATVSDPEIANLTQLTAALTSPHTGDSLSANNSAAPGIAVSFAGGTLTLSGSDTLANYQAVLRTIKYTNTAGGPLVDSLSINLQASDGSLSSNVAVATVTFPPILDLNGGVGGTGNTAGWFNSGPVPITDMADATITAPSGLANLTGITVVESTFHTGDVLSVPSVFGISGISQSYSAGTLSLSGSNSVANYQKLLRLLNYDNTSGGPGVSSFTASVTATDGVLTSAPVTATINSTVLTGEVLGNRLFYNGSKYDNNHTAIEPASDALAIASDKIGFSGSGTATFANVSSFSKGITGVMVDLQSGIGAHGSISLADFSFHTSPAYSAGTYNNIGTWNTAPTPSGFSVILGGGTDGSDRLAVTWNASLIKNEWLEVDLAANDNTGLSAPDIFYFGSAVGESGLGNTASQITVNASDVTEERNNLSSPFGTTPVWNVVDFNNDGIVNASDGTVSSGNSGFTLHFIANPSGPFAPTGDSGISSGLAASRLTRHTGSLAVIQTQAGGSNPAGSVGYSSIASALGIPARTDRPDGKLPAWLLERLTNTVDAQSASAVEYFRQLAEAGTALDHDLLLADEVQTELGLDVDLLDSLLADLGLV